MEIWAVLKVVLLVVAGCIAVFFLFIVFMLRKIVVFRNDISFHWQKIGDLVAKGHIREKCRSLLPALYESGDIQIRMIDDLSPEAITRVNIEGFAYRTVHLHQFRRVRGGKRRRLRIPLSIFTSKQAQVA